MSNGHLSLTNKQKKGGGGRDSLCLQLLVELGLRDEPVRR